MFPSRLGLFQMDWEKGRILALSVEAGLYRYARHKLQEDHTLMHGINGRPLLLCALLFTMNYIPLPSYSYDLSILWLLLEAGGDPNQTDIEPGANPNQTLIAPCPKNTVWGFFLRRCDERRIDTTVEMIRVLANIFILLLKHGAVPGEMRQTKVLGQTIEYPISSTASEIIERCCRNEAYRENPVIEKKRGFGI